MSSQFTFILAIILGAAVTVSAQSESIPAAAESTVYGMVVFNSGGFRAGLERSVRVLSKVAENNSENEVAFVITYAGGEKIRLRQEATSDRLELADAIQNLYAEAGSGALLDAIKLASEQLIATRLGHDQTSSLVIATDGDTRDSAVKADELLKYLLENKVRLHVLVIAGPRAKHDSLDRLIRGTGGKIYTYTDDPDATADAISADIKVK
ncbi:MAG TPA: vWA domain-containing protein [Pyrinomonadaceae bacterium]|nr:vWA domain-containing protein [Pyrinomonadaceae bacterium]